MEAVYPSFLLKHGVLEFEMGRWREKPRNASKTTTESDEVALAQVRPEDISHRDMNCSRRCHKSPGCEVPLRDGRESQTGAAV
jgi:hypothetical protein